MNSRTPLGDIYVELYLNEPSDSNCVALYRHGTRVVEDLARIDGAAPGAGQVVEALQQGVALRACFNPRQYLS